MDFGGPEFVLAIIGMSYAAWLITSWIRARHGYPLENEWGGSVEASSRESETVRALKGENEQLKATVGKLEDRLKVLERIATDPSRKLADEIEQLR